MDRKSALGAARSLKARAGRTMRRLRNRSRLVFPDDAGLLRAMDGRHGTLDEALADVLRGTASLLPPGLTDESVAVFYAAHPEARTALRESAALVLARTFDLLGSGPVTLGRPLPWHADFKSGRVYDAGADYELLREQVVAGFGNGSDVKVPWELSRCQHLPLLGQAFRLAPDQALYAEFRDQVSDWIGANPTGLGVNWTCTMDVAIRAVNWVWATALFRTELLEDPVFASLLLRSLLAHARFIAANLERGSGANSNHYYADLLGLLFLGALFRTTSEGESWLSLAALEIERENHLQTYPDGVDYEASIAYHRLMTEMTLTAIVMLERTGNEAPGLRLRARLMAGYVAHYLKPDGSAPQIGDNDDGRLQILGGHQADRRDHRSLLAVAGCLLEDPALVSLACGEHEEAFWLCGPETLARRVEAAAGAAPKVTGAFFPSGGIVVQRHDDLHLVLDAGPVGLQGQGAHAHNDTLSFEFQAGGQDLIVDPGTGCYTPDLALRDRFRATAAHNTVRVDGEEINPLPDRPFALPGVDRPVVRRAEFRRRFDLLDAEHGGYLRLDDPVLHRRMVLLDGARRRVVIEDRLEGKAAHRLEWFFHLAPEVQATLHPERAVLTGHAGSVDFVLEGQRLPAGMRLRLEPDLFSPGYGRVVPSQTLVCEWEGPLPVLARFILSLPGPRDGAKGAMA